MSKIMYVSNVTPEQLVKCKERARAIGYDDVVVETAEQVFARAMAADQDEQEANLEQDMNDGIFVVGLEG